MEQRTVTIPFDLETAKKINTGGIVGRIVTEKGRNRAEIVYEDNSSICPLLVVIHSTRSLNTKKGKMIILHSHMQV